MQRPLLAVLAAWLAIATAAAAPDADGPAVERLLADLGAPAWDTREEASRRLLALGVRALAAIEARGADPDLEVATRARRLARQIVDDGPPELAAARILAAPENAWMAEAWRMLVGARIRGEQLSRRQLAAIGVVAERERALEEVEDPSPTRLGHVALGREIGHTLLRQPLARWGDVGLEILRKQRLNTIAWPDLLHDAAIAGALRGQGLEDAYVVLLTGGEAHGTPVEVDAFADAHGARGVVAVLARLAGTRGEGDLATSWDEAIARASRGEAAVALARALHTPNPRELRREHEMRLVEKVAYERGEPLARRGEGAAELALLAVGLELREARRDAEGCLAPSASVVAGDPAPEPGPVVAVLARIAERADLPATERAHARALARLVRPPRGRSSGALELAGDDGWRRAANRHFGEERSLDALREALLLAAIREAPRGE